MDRAYSIKSNNLDDKCVGEKSITIKLLDDKFKEIREVAIDSDDAIKDILTYLRENNLLDICVIIRGKKKLLINNQFAATKEKDEENLRKAADIVLKND
ncbi:hypothetical protein [Clostridium sp. 1001275B_160808_H3]|uniref:hypothetical protein n=1 Tax=Clostridium sp. 1001275B_160808_H3 TaxID=2787110 RepID=UPI00189AFFD8|nr:hypothetical protein [Clostridium sp. 1001275B_160808_H3]